MAADGAWLGWAALPAIMFGAALLGLVEVLVRQAASGGHRADQPIAFGTWLAAAIWLLWLFGIPGS